MFLAKQNFRISLIFIPKRMTMMNKRIKTQCNELETLKDSLLKDKSNKKLKKKWEFKKKVLEDFQYTYNCFEELLNRIEETKEGDSNQSNSSSDEDSSNSLPRLPENRNKSKVEESYIIDLLERYNERASLVIREDRVLDLDLSEREDIKAFININNELSGLIMHDLEVIKLDFINEKQEDNVIFFIKCLFPQVCNELFLRSERLNRIKFVPNLEECAPNVLRKLTLGHYDIGSGDLKSIVNYFHHVDEMHFLECKIDSESVYFSSTLTFKIKKLCFRNTGGESYSGWLNNPKQLKGLLKAIKKSKWNSFTTFEETGSYIPSFEISEMFSKRGLGHIEIIQNT
ncbi:unnamed protein product [Moneuplotes crassus]|uniref:Uncharacterized protein n=1 Tax=Euplotes crassus TaxID=5936 RepID=A0AAD2DB91_EUPCR|nr:unnamed protein product [Moneuplotes crassus]